MHQYWQFTDPAKCDDTLDSADIWTPLATCPFPWQEGQDLSAALLAAGYRTAAELGFFCTDEDYTPGGFALWFSTSHAPGLPPYIDLATFPEWADPDEVAIVMLTTAEDLAAYSCSGGSNAHQTLYALATHTAPSQAWEDYERRVHVMQNPNYVPGFGWTYHQEQETDSTSLCEYC